MSHPVDAFATVGAKEREFQLLAKLLHGTNLFPWFPPGRLFSVS